MKTIALLLVVAVPALADPPADAPVVDMPGTSVHLPAGQPAPFPGQLLSDEENIRRAKVAADCKATLADAEQGVLLPKPAVAALISVAAAAIISSVTLGIAVATKK
jgi:hypothetical protein